MSTAAIQDGYAAATGSRSSVRAIAEAARRGDSAALTVLQAAMGQLGRALAPWFDRFRADEVVIGGSMSRSWDLLEKPLRESINDASADGAAHALRASRLFDHAPLVGAAEWVLRGPGERTVPPGRPPPLATRRADAATIPAAVLHPGLCGRQRQKEDRHEVGVRRSRSP
ncbi:ROK family protein [Sinomonas atrocyanea]